jgi:hypothetical protein
MDDKNTSSDVLVDIESLCSLSVECWRLRQLSADPSATIDKIAIRHIGRRIAQTLQTIGFETLDLSGRVYDSGMAPEVVEVIDAGKIENGAIVDETISPIVTWRGKVLHAGQIIVRKKLPQS